MMVGEGLLQRAERLGRAECLHRLYGPPVRLDAEHKAGACGEPVHQHCAGAADPVLTANVGAGERQVVAQHIGERAARFDGQFVLGAVHREPDRMNIGHWVFLLLSTGSREPAPAIAATTSAGRTGMRPTLAPTCASASLTAFSTAAGAPMVPPSPIPLAPIGFLVVGVQRWWISKSGRSAAVGRR